ncbi:hypothetical protein Slin15195_G048570 [Septoria linicola]|uniref:Mmc1 C-terminal domain-containing protein n=1 Tax=Septoria linicola TaxID=215465 RepID=A0A9Q9ASW9_9PEZI|nr:hypothetical protein Slin14017_G052130 [Septoria linicola]USW51538.1 hypothetical protein Slin15195_G048570 [Septoria linicola]
MPPRTALAARTARLLQQSEAYVCPSCLFTNRIKHQNPHSRLRPHATKTRPIESSQQRVLSPKQHRRRRTYASLASTTAINAPTSVPPHLHPLYQSLLHLESTASSYIDLSRLQLALRSLESSDPVIRIAFLGLGVNGDRAARRLVRVLLADALSDGVEEWEEELLNDDRSGSVLIRYGETVKDVGVVGGGGGGRDGRVRELRVPSPLLRRAGVEVLVTGLNSSHAARGENQDGIEDSVLVPALTIPGAGGRVGFVRYPVHKAVIVSEGVSGAVELGRLPRGLADGRMISSALSLPLRRGDGVAKRDEEGGVVDVGLAEHALALFRENRANGAVFSREWQESRVGNVSTWMSENAKVDEKADGLKPAVKDLVEALLERTEATVEAAESAAQSRHASRTMPDAKRTALREAIATWARDAHHDLQTNLASAFLGPAWRRTTWWRLFWRIDEVSISAADVLRRGWLVEAEQNLAFLSGRLLEAGVATENQLRGISQPINSSETSTQTDAPAEESQTLLDPRTEKEMSDYDAVQQGILKDGRPETVAELMQLPPLLSKIREETGLNALFNPPWPQTVNLAREQILHELVPALHAKAQRLMLASLSTIGGSSALGVWLWVASGGVALYESGAIAALGFVWALRILQKKYGREREVFAGEIREDARRVLADVESRLVGIVERGGRVEMRMEDAQERQAARKVVQAVRQTL